MRRLVRRADRQEGSASIELLGMIPLVFLFAAIGLQVGVFLWAVTNANEAVRQGARAQSLGQDGCAAARSTLAGSLTRSLDPGWCSASGGPTMYTETRLRITVEVPVLDLVDGYVPPVVIQRTAVLP